MNQRIYGDDLTNNKHPFTKGMQNLVKNLEKIDGIAKAMQNGDCNHSEGVIRLSMLLLPFGQSLQPYQAMYALYNIVKEMPTHEARKALLKKERMKLDLERESAEAKFEEEIMLELRQFLNDVEKFGEA